MDTVRSESSASKRPPVLLSLAFLFGGFVLYVVLWQMFDPPPTWTRCPQPSALELSELSARRGNFLPVAIPLVTLYAILLAWCAWTCAADRRARQGHKRLPGRLVGSAMIILVPLWGLLVGHAFVGSAIGGAIFWGFILAGAGTLTSVGLAVGVFAGLFHSPSRSRSEDVMDSLAVGLTWSLLLFAVPLFFIGVGVAGKDATFVC
jgi:hypothetical protein